MVTPRFTTGSHYGWDGKVRFEPAPKRILDVRLEDDAIWPLTVTIEPLRVNGSPPAPANETEAEVHLEWGTGQGASHRTRIDVLRGTVFSVSAAHLRVSIRNVGTGRSEGSVPEGRWRASVAIGATSRVLPPIRCLQIRSLLPGASTEQLEVPAFAGYYTVSRFPQVDCRVQFFNGSGEHTAEYIIPARMDFRGRVPVGADRAVIINNDETSIRLARLEFELNL